MWLGRERRERFLVRGPESSCMHSLVSHLSWRPEHTPKNISHITDVIRHSCCALFFLTFATNPSKQTRLLHSSPNTRFHPELNRMGLLRVGTVISTSSAKTAVVWVTRQTRHPLYGRTQRLSRKFHVHDEHEVAKLGDRVSFTETRPLSRLKRWALGDVVLRARPNDAGLIRKWLVNRFPAKKARAIASGKAKPYAPAPAQFRG